tara:strand:+ start:1275 stop:2033 length:759 start_codon:yes stop_codon:yes gene_type:complete
MKKIIVIPARLSSTRLANKLLLDLKGKTILQRVYEQCKKVKDVIVYIATDSLEIKKSSLEYTKNIIMTSNEHKSGTDRITEAVKDLDYEVLINVQGDEPFINPSLINDLFQVLQDEKVKVATVCEKVSLAKELFDPNIVKLVKDNSGYALYFSRSCIPFIRDNSKLLSDEKKYLKTSIFYKHVGIYGYKKDFLNRYSFLNFSNLEKIEVLEQLRILESGFKIKVLETRFKSLGIDTKEDYNKALKMITNDIQ